MTRPFPDREQHWVWACGRCPHVFASPMTDAQGAVHFGTTDAAAWSLRRVWNGPATMTTPISAFSCQHCHHEWISRVPGKVPGRCPRCHNRDWHAGPRGVVSAPAPIRSKPRRVQLSRAKGWRLPANTVVVSRPSKYSNPYVVGVHAPDNATAVRMYTDYLAANPELVEEARRELAGRNLGCWCAPSQACHADPLLRVVNRELVAVPAYFLGARPHGFAGASR